MNARITSLVRTGSVASALVLICPLSSALADHRQHERRHDDRGERREAQVWVPPRYEERVRVVVEPAVYENRTRREWVEPVYRIEQVRIPVPAVYETRTRRVWDPPVTEVRKVPVIEPAVYETRRVRIVERGRVAFRTERILVRPERTVFVDKVVEIKPGCWREVTEQVCVQPETFRIEDRKVCLKEGFWKTCTERVLVKPECRREVRERVLVEPGHFESRGSGHHHGFSIKFGLSTGR